MGFAYARASAAITGRYRSGGFVPPLDCCCSQLTVVGGCLMHAAQWPGAFSSRGGTIVAHAASRAGCWQRGWNTHPLGGFAGEGTSPASRMRSRLTPGSGAGTAESSAWVYGMIGSL